MKNNNNNNNYTNLEDSQLIPFRLSTFTLEQFQSIIIKHSIYMKDGIMPEDAKVRELHIFDSLEIHKSCVEFALGYETILPEYDIEYKNTVERMYYGIIKICLDLDEHFDEHSEEYQNLDENLEGNLSEYLFECFEEHVNEHLNNKDDIFYMYIKTI